jgi:hypothetical protein
MNNEEKLFEIYRNYSDLLDRAWIILNDITVTLDTHSYYYAALDLRICIERLLSIVLIIVHKGEISKNQQKIYKVKEFIKEIEKAEFPYSTSIKLLNSKAHKKFGKKFKEIDFGKLNTHYGKLCNILHLNNSLVFYIDSQEDLVTIEQVVLRAYEYLDNYRDYEKLLELL